MSRRKIRRSLTSSSRRGRPGEPIVADQEPVEPAGRPSPPGRHLACEMAVAAAVGRPGPASRRPAEAAGRWRPGGREKLERLGQRADRERALRLGAGRLDQPAGEPPARQQLLLGDRQPGERLLEPGRRHRVVLRDWIERPAKPDRRRRSVTPRRSRPRATAAGAARRPARCSRCRRAPPG